MTPESVGAYRIEGPNSECDGIISTSEGGTDPVTHCFPPGTLDRLYSPGHVASPPQQEVPQSATAFDIEDLTEQSIEDLEELLREDDP